MFQKAAMDMIQNTIQLEGATGKAVSSMINDFTLFMATVGESDDKVVTALQTLQQDYKKRDKTYSNRIQ